MLDKLGNILYIKDLVAVSQKLGCGTMVDFGFITDIKTHNNDGSLSKKPLVSIEVLSLGSKYTIKVQESDSRIIKIDKINDWIKDPSNYN